MPAPCPSSCKIGAGSRTPRHPKRHFQYAVWRATNPPSSLELKICRLVRMSAWGPWRAEGPPYKKRFVSVVRSDSALAPLQSYASPTSEPVWTSRHPEPFERITYILRETSKRENRALLKCHRNMYVTFPFFTVNRAGLPLHLRYFTRSPSRRIKDIMKISLFQRTSN